MIVAVLLSIVPSEEVKVKLSVPLKFSFGVYTASAPVRVTVPLVGAVPIVYVKSSPSTSDADKLIICGVSSSFTVEPSTDIGALLGIYSLPNNVISSSPFL